MQHVETNPSANTAPPLPSSGINDIKVMLDGEFLRVSAVVDASGAKKLLKRIKTNIALLVDDDDE